MTGASPAGRRPSAEGAAGAPFAKFERVALLGVGLMGASLGMALRENGLAKSVVGWDRSAQALSLAVERGAVDFAEAGSQAAVRGADAVFVAVPVSAAPALLEEIAPFVGANAIVSDLGSVKAAVVDAGGRLLGERFVGGHPMSGSELSGPGAARSDLFTGAVWAVVPTGPADSAPSPAVLRLVALITAIEARPLLLDSQSHDRIVALTSHLPHLLAFALRAAVEADRERELALLLCGGSYRDMTRVAASDKAMWAGIFRENRRDLLQALEAFEGELGTLIRSIRDPDEGSWSEAGHGDSPIANGGNPSEAVHKD